jgi:hypothetical protein
MGFAKPWLLFAQCQSKMARRPGDPVIYKQPVEQRDDPIEAMDSDQSTYRAHPLTHLLTKAAAYFKWLVLPKHVIAGTRQLIRQRLDRDNPVAWLIKASCLGARGDGKVGRFDECPRQVPVTVLRVAFAFLPAVAFPSSVRQVGVRTLMTLRGPFYWNGGRLAI